MKYTIDEINRLIDSLLIRAWESAGYSNINKLYFEPILENQKGERYKLNIFSEEKNSKQAQEALRKYVIQRYIEIAALSQSIKIPQDLLKTLKEAAKIDKTSLTINQAEFYELLLFKANKTLRTVDYYIDKQITKIYVNYLDDNQTPKELTWSFRRSRVDKEQGSEILDHKNFPISEMLNSRMFKLIQQFFDIDIAIKKHKEQSEKKPNHFRHGDVILTPITETK